jgi:hypothetical protein
VPVVRPSGSIADGTQETSGPRSGLQVTATGIGTFDLPNTPVEPVVEPVA